MKQVRWRLDYHNRKICGGWNGDGSLKAFSFPKEGLTEVSIEENTDDGPKQIAKASGDDFDHFYWVRNGKISGASKGENFVKCDVIGLELYTKDKIYSASIYGD